MVVAPVSVPSIEQLFKFLCLLFKSCILIFFLSIARKVAAVKAKKAAPKKAAPKAVKKAAPKKVAAKKVAAKKVAKPAKKAAPKKAAAKRQSGKASAKKWLPLLFLEPIILIMLSI